MATTNIDATSALGFGLYAVYCTAILPYPDGNGGAVMRAITTVQPTLGLATDPKTGAPLPDAASGRTLLVGAIECRIVTPLGGLIDTTIPTTTAQYGVSLDDAIAADMTTAEAAQFSSGIDAQIRLDERVKNSTTTAVLVGDTLAVPITILDGQGPFRLTLAIDVLTQDLSVLSSPT